MTTDTEQKISDATRALRDLSAHAAALDAAFTKRTASVARTADECITLTNERDALQRKLSTLILAAQYVCQTVNGSDPEATKRAHALALVRLMDALQEVNP